MKRFLFILLVLAACKKGGSDKGTQIHLKESKSGTAIQGVTVKLLRCDFGCPFGGKKLFEGLTDAEGNVYVNPKDYADASGGMSIEKPKYWSLGFTLPQTSVTMIPEGWLRIRILKTGSYPAAAKLKLTIHSEPLSPDMLDIQEYFTAADSSILLRGYGAQLNRIDWQVSDNITLYNSGTFNQQVPKFDTVKNVTLNY